MPIPIPYVFIAGTIIDPDQMNANFQSVASNAASDVGGTIDTPMIDNATLAGTVNISGAQFQGDLLFVPDNTYDIGKDGANRPRDGFFARNVTVGSILTVSGTGIHNFTGTGTGEQVLSVNQTLSGSGNSAKVRVVSGGVSGYLESFPPGYATVNQKVATGVLLEAEQGGGLSIAASSGSGAIRFYSGGATERMQIRSDGRVFMGLAVDRAGFVQIASNQALFYTLLLQTTVDVGGGFFAVFENASGAIQGGVVAVNSTTVAYNTTSDQRLKTDAGMAADLSGLRTLMVHDFTWKADGTRDRGIFAQETQPIFPRAITVGSDGHDLSRPWMTDYSKFVPDLIVGWQQHDERLARLESLLIERTV